MDDDSFGKRLAALAEEKDLDATDLSRAAGLKEGTIYRLLRGDQHTTSIQAGLRLADLLGVDPWYLAFGRSKQALSGASHATDAEALGEASRLAPPDALRLQKIENDVRATRLNLVRLESTLKVLESRLRGVPIASKRRKKAVRTG